MRPIPSWFAIFGATSALLLGAVAHAQTSAAPAPASNARAAVDTIRKTLTPRLTPGTVIDAIAPSPVHGLFEVQIGSELLYVTESGTFMFQGDLVNLETGSNLTKARSEALITQMEKAVMPDLWSSAALADAVKLVKGKGTRKVVVFEDPYCGYCKKLRQSFAELDDITIYTFMVAGLSADSAPKARDLWCAADRAKAYDDWMTRGKAPASADKSCTDPIKRVAALAKRLGVAPVPHVLFSDGTKNMGYLSAGDLNARLATVKPVF
jgi:thiol:disulfide interchange protein DsbC